jgi:hypothetical protein
MKAAYVVVVERSVVGNPESARDDKFRFGIFVRRRNPDGKIPFDRSSATHSAAPIAPFMETLPSLFVIP